MQPTEVNGTALVPQPQNLFTGVLSKEEQPIVLELLSATKPTDQIIPDDMDPEKLWKYLSVTCKAMTKATDAMIKLKMLLGRMFEVIQNYPELYKAQGYKTYDDFMTHGVPAIFGISRPEAYIAKRVAKVLGFMSPPELASLGISKAGPVATAIQRDTTPDMPKEMLAEKRKKWLDVAKSKTVEELRAAIVDKGLADDGELEYAVITIKTNDKIKKEWDEFCKDPLIIGYVGDDGGPGGILENMISECESTWKPQAEAQLRGNDR